MRRHLTKSSEIAAYNPMHMYLIMHGKSLYEFTNLNTWGPHVIEGDMNTLEERRGGLNVLLEKSRPALAGWD